MGLFTMRKNAGPVRIALLIFLFAFILTGSARASFLDKLEWKTEKHFGKVTKQQIEQEYGFVDNPLLTKYVSDMGASLSGVSHRTDIPYEFHVIDTGEVNAFAAPGGFIFVTRGLLDEISSDDELAAVMGHEVGHVAAHHGAKRIKKLPILIAGMNILYNNTDETTARIGGMVLSLMQLHYSREDEYQADQLGVEYSFNAGYDPHAMTSFFHKLESQYRTGDLNKLEVSLMSHPKTTSRMMKIASYSQMDEQDPDTLIRIGDSYRKRYYFNHAAEQYRKALELAPDSTPAALGLGLASLELGDSETAYAQFHAVATREPENQVALNGLNSALALAQGHTGQEAPTADPALVQEANDALAEAVMQLEDHVQVLRKNSRDAAGEIAAVNHEFDRSLVDFARTAKNISEYDESRYPVLEGAAIMFSGLFDALGELDVASDEMVIIAENALKRGRIALFHLNRGGVTEPMAREALRMARTLNRYDESLPDIQRNVHDALDASHRLYRESAVVMDELHETLTEEDEGLLEIRSRLLLENLSSSSDNLRTLQSATEQAGAMLNKSDVGIRRTALNLNTALLSPQLDTVYRKMCARRFRVPEPLLERLLAMGYGYGDIVLLASRSMQRGYDLNSLADGINSTHELERLLAKTPETSNSGEDVLLAMAEMDLRELTGDEPGIRFVPPEDIRQAADLTAPESEPLSAEPELAAALEQIMGGQPEQAIETLHARGQSKPATATSHKLLGLAYKHAGFYDEAKEEFKNSSKKYPEDYQAHFLWGNTFQELERYDDALNEYDSALELNPECGPAHLGRAYTLAMTGRLDQAELALFKALDLGANQADVHRNLGLLYYEQGRYYEALAEFQASLDADEDQPAVQELASKLGS